MQNNIPAVLSVMKFIYNNIMYAELNTKSDYCECCGYDGEMAIKEDESGKLIWECPNCGNQDQNHMFVARRTCGYIGTQFWNQGRLKQRSDFQRSRIRPIASAVVKTYASRGSVASQPVVSAARFKR